MADSKNEVSEKLEAALLKFKQGIYLSAIQEALAVTAPALVVLLESGRIAYATEPIRTLFGYTPDELIGQPLEMLMPERYRARHAEHFARYAANPTARAMGLVEQKLHGLTKDGKEFEVMIGLYPKEVIGEDCVIGTILKPKA